MISRFLTFTGGITSLQVPVVIVDDSIREPSEEFVANITVITTDLEVVVDPDQTIIIIIDNDGMILKFLTIVHSIRYIADQF